MADRQPNELSATEALAGMRAGELTSEALVTACLGRIDAREAAVGAWQHLDRDGALQAARAADLAALRGPLHGIPVGIKDIIDTADMPTALGSPIYATRRPAWDAACVAAIRAAGGIILGKTVTTEFAYFTPGKTRNPHDLDPTPGGSSSGCSARACACARSRCRRASPRWSTRRWRSWPTRRRATIASRWNGIATG